MCEGNSDSRFLDVTKRHDGVFMDHSGKSYMVCCLEIYNNYRFE